MVIVYRSICFRLLSVCAVLSCLTVHCGAPGKATGSDEVIINAKRPVVETSYTSPATTQKESVDYASIQKKYGGWLNISPDKITNKRLYTFIDQWIFTPYKWGGDDKNGIDCSAFMQRLLQDVYNIYIPRTSVEQFFDKWIERFGSTRHLAEGDLVFFRTMEGKVISHVGLYLNNRMFINASSSKGVSLGNLDDPYWKSKYVAAGRIKQSMISQLRQ